MLFNSLTINKVILFLDLWDVIQLDYKEMMIFFLEFYFL